MTVTRNAQVAKAAKRTCCSWRALRSLRSTLLVLAALGAIAVTGPRGRAQEYDVNTTARGVDLSGEWAPVREEDNTGNTELGDWVGIPMNEAARLRAMAWVASIQTLPEWQCRRHAVSYSSRGPSQR